MPLKVRAILNETPQPKTLADVPQGQVWECETPAHTKYVYVRVPGAENALKLIDTFNASTWKPNELKLIRKIADRLEFVFDDMPEMPLDRQAAARELAATCLHNFNFDGVCGQLTRQLARKVLGENP